MSPSTPCPNIRRIGILTGGGDSPGLNAAMRDVGFPTTIENDTAGTEVTLGFQSAVATATQALDQISTTADSHHRAMVVEVMGRNSGWIALHAGIASGSDVILIPEIPFKLQSLLDKVRQRCAMRQRPSL